METLRAELAKAGLPTDNEACVLHAMFPREFAALHAPAAAPKPAAPAAPAPSPAAQAAAATPAAANPAPSAGPGRQLAMTINGRRIVASVEELS
jgi:oxaloacetate decarboxylase alpha subunit/pyruvate carboxylase subunit B